MKLFNSICRNHTVVTLEGDLNSHTLSQHRDALNKMIEQSSLGVVLDLQKVNFLDSSGVGAIIFWFKRLRSRRVSFTVVGLQGQPAKLAQLLRLDHTLHMLENLSAWLRYLDQYNESQTSGIQSC